MCDRYRALLVCQLVIGIDLVCPENLNLRMGLSTFRKNPAHFWPRHDGGNKSQPLTSPEWEAAVRCFCDLFLKAATVSEPVALMMTASDTADDDADEGEGD